VATLKEHPKSPERTPPFVPRRSSQASTVHLTPLPLGPPEPLHAHPPDPGAAPPASPSSPPCSSSSARVGESLPHVACRRSCLTELPGPAPLHRSRTLPNPRPLPLRRQEPVHFDKITARIVKLSWNLNAEHCDPASDVGAAGGIGADRAWAHVRARCALSARYRELIERYAGDLSGLLALEPSQRSLARRVRPERS